MIEVTCAACGTLNRIAEGDVSPGAKFVSCASCKSRVGLPGSGTTGAVQRVTTSALPKLPATGAIPKVPSIPVPAIPKVPPPIPGVGGAAKRTDAIDLADLPAPKRTSPLATLESSKPAPRSALADAELPAPKAAAKAGGAPLDLDDVMPADLPAPKSKTATPDLPAPKTKTAPVPRVPAADVGIADLPAPKGKTATPAPRTGGMTLDDDILDLPQPKAQSEIVDLPTPKKPSEIVDLPAPKGITDLPAPKPGANNDLPAPKGFFDDLPQPAKGGGKQSIDLPAPKGFFDDLPQPAKGGGNKPDLPAPKGFFDDLPQRAKGGNKPELPAPKGFFDDLPQPAQQAKGGVFDDMPEPAKSKGIRELSSSDLFTPPAGTEIQLDGPSLHGGKPLELADSAGPELDLGAGGFKDLELAEPSRVVDKSAESPIKIKAKADGSTPRLAMNNPLSSGTAPKKDRDKDGPLELALEDEPRSTPGQQPKARLQAKQARAEESTAASAAKKKRSQKILAGVLAVAMVGSGGAYFYQRHAATAKKAAEIDQQLTTARASLEAATPNHWQKAATAARAVVDLDPHNAAAYGIGAEALIAGALDNGVNATAKIGQGRMLIGKAQEAGVTGPELDRAQAVSAIASNQPDRAISKLQGAIAANPKDGFLQLYMGWAQLAKGDGEAAIKAFDAAVANAPGTKLAALYGHGRAKLMLADIAGAKADFAAVLEVDRNNVGAQVGLAATLPPSQSSQREADLLALLASKDIANADPRAVVQAWTLAADVARQGGRLDVARDRYGKALALSANDTAALTGLAEVELRDGKVAAAQEDVQKALATAPEDVDANLVAAELAIRQGRLPDALATINKLGGHAPPLPPMQQAHLLLVNGRLLEAQGKDDDAIEAFQQAAKLAGDLDLSPTMAAVEKLSALAKKAADAHDDAKAEDYRKRADALLSNLAERAQEDPQLSLTLGTAYLQAGDAAKAENLLRRTVEMRGNDPDARLQLGKALAKLGRTDDAVDQLQAALKIDSTRTDIGLELARTLENAGKYTEAAAAYDKLLADKNAPLLARIYAGKYFARQGDIKKAAALADPILLLDSDNAAGHYLKGEGLLASGKLDEARTELTRATSADGDVQYWEALGRAAEASFAATNDTKFQELAIQAYEHATESDPSWFAPWAGLGRVHVQRHQFKDAIPELDHAYKIKADAEVALNFGLAYKTLGPKPTAIQWLETSAKLDGKRAETWFRLGELYRDSNRPGDDHKMIDALDRATRLGVEEEAKGAQLDWLTEAFYTLGDQYMLVHNESAAKRAWSTYVARRPKDVTHLETATNALQTTLKSVP
jgi:tetratricopeptide (TPR) repeat protein